MNAFNDLCVIYFWEFPVSTCVVEKFEVCRYGHTVHVIRKHLEKIVEIRILPWKLPSIKCWLCNRIFEYDKQKYTLNSILMILLPSKVYPKICFHLSRCCRTCPYYHLHLEIHGFVEYLNQNILNKPKFKLKSWEFIMQSLLSEYSTNNIINLPILFMKSKGCLCQLWDNWFYNINSVYFYL